MAQDRSTQSSRKVGLPGKRYSNPHGARPIHPIITMIKWTRTSRLSIKNSLSAGKRGLCSWNAIKLGESTWVNNDGSQHSWSTDSSFLAKFDFAPIRVSSQVVELRFRISGNVNLRIGINRSGLFVRAGERDHRRRVRIGWWLVG